MVSGAMSVERQVENRKQRRVDLFDGVAVPRSTALSGIQWLLDSMLYLPCPASANRAS